MRSLLSARSLAGRIFLIELLIVLLLVAGAVASLVVQAHSSAENDARRVTQSVAATFANTSGVVQALQGPNPTAALQPQATAVELATGVDSVVVFNTDFIQLTSPYAGYVGQPYQPPADVRDKVVPQLRAGKTVTFTLNEPGYQSISTAVPIFGPNGTPLGVVAVNIGVAKVDSLVGSNLPAVLGAAAAALAVAAFGTAFAARRLARETRGLGPTELARMYDHHNAVLHAVREGVLIISGDGRMLLANDEARRLLDLPADAERRTVDELGLDADTAALLLGSEGEVTDAIHPAGDRLLAVNRRPTAPYGGLPSNVVTLRDSTELHELAGRVEAADRRSRLLHEAGMRIGRTLDMVRTCEELAALVVPRFADGVTVDLLDEVARGEDPSGADSRLRRMAERGAPAGAGSRIGVPLRVRDLALGVVEFRRAPDREEFGPDDEALAEELAARAAVSIDNARRYTREHGLAVALQHSLLPRRLPDRTALELAFRYLPAHAGVGGDWFDAIPLPGFRTALVVGDVVGHGISAAVAMGRLRTSIRSFAALDLPPDEVLGRLDELVAQLDEEGAGPEISGSTCAYAVFDPVSGDCVLALAGHPRPALLDPDGRVSHPAVAVSPPLGIGGHPFETTVLRLAPGSSLVLFTDGLVEHRGEDIEVGLERLRAVLAEQSGRDPEQLCAAVTRSALADRPADDVALLVARTSVLAADRVAEWQVSSDPAAVAPVRAEAAERLAEWGLAELGFATELILSELVTNAIRYGAPPVRVRLLHDTSLVCEVSDASSTAPHLRWAKTTDEGGRGLFLVAQLAHRWGTRYTGQGKVIWCELLLPG